MSRYINFSTFPGKHSEFSRGKPLHNGESPPRFREALGVKVDGRSVEFAEAEVIERLHRAIVDGKRLRRRRISYDCVSFAALMNNIQLRSRHDNPFNEADQNIDVDPMDVTVSNPVNLGNYSSRSGVWYVHTVTPAHLTEGPSYLHKLGDKGPICMSGLDEAMEIYGATIANPVPQISARSSS